MGKSFLQFVIALPLILMFSTVSIKAKERQVRSLIVLSTPADVNNTFHCADYNCDGIVDTSDYIYLRDFMFKGGQKPRNQVDIHSISITDLTRLIDFLYRNGIHPTCSNKASLTQKEKNQHDLSLGVGITIEDLTILVDYLYRNGTNIKQKTLDFNEDGKVNIIDLTYAIHYLFLSNSVSLLN